jgi:hypothetical protein
MPVLSAPARQFSILAGRAVLVSRYAAYWKSPCVKNGKAHRTDAHHHSVSASELIAAFAKLWEKAVVMRFNPVVRPTRSLRYAAWGQNEAKTTELVIS